MEESIMVKRKRIEEAVAAVLLIIVALLIYYVCSSLGGKNTTQISDICFEVNGEVINLWSEENTGYLFLPASIDLSTVKVAEKSEQFTLLEDIQLGEKIPCIITKTNQNFDLVIMQSANLPAIYIQTKSGNMESIHADKEHEENARLTIINPDGTTVYDENLDYIKGRGNLSWTAYDKKSYAFVTKEETDFYNMGRGTDWILTANAVDETLIRNDITRKLADTLGIAQTEPGQFVDLYLNGNYAGNYYLSEKIEVGEDRLNIANLEKENKELNGEKRLSKYPVFSTDTMKGRTLSYDPEDISGGYLIEREYDKRYDLEYDAMKSGFTTANGEDFVVHSPNYCSEREITYITDYVNEAEKAILAEDGINPDTGLYYTEYIDLDSFVQKYLVEEISKNYDAGVTSSFFYKQNDSEGGLLFAGPGWDYDNTFGNYSSWMEGFVRDPEGVTKLSAHYYCTKWFAALYEKEDFYNLMLEYFVNLAEPFMEDLLDGGLEEELNWIDASAKMDQVRWQSAYRENDYFESREQEIEYLTDYIRSREEYLENVWAGAEEDCMIKLIRYDDVFDVLYVPHGSALEELPEQDSYDWVDGETGEAYSSGMSILRDTIFYAREKD